MSRQLDINFRSVSAAPATFRARSAATVIRSRASVSGRAFSFNPSVHGARGLLAVLVCIFHVYRAGVPGFAVESSTLAHAGLMSLQFGVEVFFCISGFIVVGALRRAATPVRFLLDRAIRILPVLWLTLAVIVPLGLATHQGVFAGLQTRDLGWILPVNLFAMAGFLPVPVLHLAAWSLSYELVFYLVAAALWSLPARHKAARFAVLAAAAALIVWHPRAVFFVVGVLVARVDLTRHRVLEFATRAPGVALLAFMAVWYVVQFTNGSNGEDSALVWVQDGRIGLAAIGVSLAILAFAGIVAGRGLLSRLLQTRSFTVLGTVSYSFYLWHLIVIAIVKRILASAGLEAQFGQYSQVALLAICLPVSVVVAYASTQLVERRFTGWLKVRCGRVMAPNIMGAAAAA